MTGGYSCTTITVHPGEPARVGVFFILGSRAWIAVPGAGTGTPHLHISHGDVSVSISPRVPGTVTADDARIGRDLAGKAAEDAGEMERRHAASPADDTSDAAA